MHYVLKYVSISAAMLLIGCTDTAQVSRNDTLLLEPGSAWMAKSLTAQMNVEVATEIYFAFDRSTLDRTAQRRLDQYAEWMMAHPKARFSVAGHADAVGTEAYNRGLGWRRAETTVAYLISKGVSYRQLHAMVTLGEDDPRIPTDERERMNRRAVIEVLGILKKPVSYLVDPGGRKFAVAPEDAVNTQTNVCGGEMVNICANAQLLALMNLETSATVSRNLLAQQEISGGLTPGAPGGSVGAGIESTVDDAGGVSGGITGGVSGTVGGLLGG